MTLITKATPIQLRLILGLILISLSITLSFGENKLSFGSKRLITAQEMTPALVGPNVLIPSLLMEDTAVSYTHLTLPTIYSV